MGVDHHHPSHLVGEPSSILSCSYGKQVQERKSWIPSQGARFNKSLVRWEIETHRRRRGQQYAPIAEMWHIKFS